LRGENGQVIADANFDVGLEANLLSEIGEIDVSAEVDLVGVDCSSDTWAHPCHPNLVRIIAPGQGQALRRGESPFPTV
jgi:hypothetical protein